MTRSCLGLVLGFTLAAIASGQDPKEEKKETPPSAPEGWRVVLGKDDSFQFFFPKQTKRNGNRDRTRNISGLRLRSSIDYCIAGDGIKYEVDFAVMSGSAVSGVKMSEVYAGLADAYREDGFTVSEPKEVTVGKLKAREYSMTKDGVAVRAVVLVAKGGRIYQLSVEADKADKLKSANCDTFLTSLFLLPKDPNKAKESAKSDDGDSSSKTSKPEKGDPSSIKWTRNLKEMVIPETSVCGKIRGKDFVPDKIEIRGGSLNFRSGKEFFADIEVDITLFLGAASAEERTWEVKQAKFNPGGSPFVAYATKEKGEKLPSRESYTGDYALKLKFGKNEGGYLPGMIYVSFPDADHSVLAGTFKVKER